jgi:phage repressor protein C with HTH and peptisase S24 domain
MSKYLEALEVLNEGKQHTMSVFGTSMLPLIESGSNLTFLKTDDYVVGDGVIVKVNGNWMTHKITKVGSDGRYMISNNKGHDNGWTKTVYGRAIAMNGKPFGRKLI